ncbi:hypothetical protein [Tenacibaculum finnmarkense]|uniref:hypothetical protein n=1 Tax=Tenacibaculum finnmarkense TaxID=2781243 RepID=UPI00187BB9B1|nr:hypothetical protein [Tenacibaculum finnmarkense]MBE7691513.1 hypothetical protein [Tenacibaculum finnmarkense genomovar finnmarkense]MCD8405125.1 hypothetical protein [Tenacibaculum dicentrarchi]
MSLFNRKQQLMSQIVETKNLLQTIGEHPIMSISINEKLNTLRQELESLPQIINEACVKLLFSGKAVNGSKGINSKFLSKTLNPFLKMVKSEANIIRFGKIQGKGFSNKAANTDLYLTSLPVGSFGIELKQLETNDLLDEIEVSEGISKIIDLISIATENSDESLLTLTNQPKEIITNLKNFLEPIVKADSVIKLESGHKYIEISKEKVKIAYDKITNSINEDVLIKVDGILKGFLLLSNKFELIDDSGRKISGTISEKIPENLLVEYDKKFLNCRCEIHMKLFKTEFITGKITESFELIEIKAPNSNITF